MKRNSDFKLDTMMLATDFSPASYGALAYGAELARLFRSKVLLTHIVDPALLSETEKSDLCNTLDSAESKLQDQAEQFKENCIESRVIVRKGDVLGTIVDLVVERKVDLLVLGTRGNSANTGGRLGSVAESLLRTMPCPVLTVSVKARSGAFDGTHSQRVLLPTDFSRDSRVALSYAESLTRRFKGKLYLLHVENGSGAAPAMTLLEQTEKFKTLSETMRDPQLVAESISCTGSPAEKIVSTVAEKGIDLVVMRVHEADGSNGSRVHDVAYEVIRQVNCPVFTLYIP